MSLLVEYFNLQSEYESKYGDKTIVFIEKGMFYEIYGIDNNEAKRGQATVVSQLLNIQLTRANKKIVENNLSNPLMTGFPVASLKKNIKVLLENGYTIVTYDQQEKVSERKVTNVFSPGTYIDEQSNTQSNFICSMFIEQEDTLFSVGLSFIELSTGQSVVYEKITEDSILFFEEISRIIESYSSKEYTIICKGLTENVINRELNGSNKMFHFNNSFSKEISNVTYQNQILEQVYTNNSQLSLIEFFDLEKLVYASSSLINLLQFCYEHNSDVLQYIDEPIIINDAEKLILHNNALYQLNIVSLGKKEKGITCLLDVIDNTSTPMGRRLLKKTLLSPITNVELLDKKYDDVENMIKHIDWFENNLKGIIDIERYHRKLSLGKLSPYEYANLQESYESVSVLLNQKFKDKSFTHQFNDYYFHYLQTFNLSQLKLNDCDNIFNEGVFPEIDILYIGIEKYRKKLENECRYLSNFLNQKENIIKFEYAAKSGYSIYSTNNRCEQLQKIVKDKYFFKKESKIKCVISSDKINKWIDELTKIQNNLKPAMTEKYSQLLSDWYSKYEQMFHNVHKIVAETDVNKSKAKTAFLYDYCKPTIQEHTDAYIHAKDMRHAIIECLDTDCDYVPNDIIINNENSGILLYGVNGSGKSCYSKAIGLCVVLAQSGHYVPCSSFDYSPFTKLYTRITGDDNIFRGHSSFFVEMTELKSILNYADSRSIVIGDEVCKGTEDVSAVAIVGTTIKHLIEKNTKFIFATHLHKLPYISILKGESRLKIKHITVEFDETTIFTRKIKDGTGDLLYGLEIAHSILRNESFHQRAFSLRNELLNKSSKLVADKKSKYNGQLYINHCQICGEKDELEAHHIVFQSKSKVRKDRKSNLVVLCSKHHDDVHGNKLIVEGWRSTTDGKMLKYTEVI